MKFLAILLILSAYLKLNCMMLTRDWSLWSPLGIKWISKQVEDRSGDILLMWDDLKHKMINFIEGSFTISENIIEHDGFNYGLLLFMVMLIERKKNSFGRSLPILHPFVVQIGSWWEIWMWLDKELRHPLQTQPDTARISSTL